MLESLTVSVFAECLGSKFRIHYGAAEPLDVELIEATPSGAPGRSAPGGREPFSLVFRGAMQPIVWQQVCRFEHDQLGPLELFMVPIGPDEVGMCYQVIFN